MGLRRTRSLQRVGLSSDIPERSPSLRSPLHDAHGVTCRFRRVRAGLAASGCVLALAVVGTGFSCEESQPEEVAQALNLRVRSSAVEAGRQAGIDIERLVRRAASDIFRVLPTHPRPIEIEVKVDPGHPMMIPELGIGGGADDERVFIVLDRPLREGIETRLRATLAHELHHVIRFRTRPAGAWTLGYALVAEGLADHFALEMVPDARRPWTDALSREQEAALWRRARPAIAVPGGYDHRSWFFGGDVPRWAGYTLGYRIVAAYLGEKRRASDEVGADVTTVVEAYERTEPR